MTFKKIQREQQLKEKQAEKLARRLERKQKSVGTEQAPGFSGSRIPDTRDSDQS